MIMTTLDDEASSGRHSSSGFQYIMFKNITAIRQHAALFIATCIWRTAASADVDAFGLSTGTIHDPFQISSQTALGIAELIRNHQQFLLVV